MSQSQVTNAAAERWRRSWRYLARRSPRSVLSAILALVLAALILSFGASLYRTAQLRPVWFACEEDVTLVIRRRDRTNSPSWLAHAPSLEPTLLPIGEYDVATYRAGGLGATFLLDVRPDELHAQVHVEIDVASTQFSAPWELPTFPAPVDLGVRHGLLTFTSRGVELFDPDTQDSDSRAGRSAWSVDLVESPPDAIAMHAGWRWPSLAALVADSARGELDAAREDSNFARPLVVAEFVDLDDDQFGDVVLAGRHQAFLCAVSGRTGQVLWFAARGGDLLQASAAVDPARSEMFDPLARTDLRSSVLDAPRLAGDVDGDGTIDLLVNTANYEPAGENPVVEKPVSNEASGGVRQTLELLSGKTGRSIWKVDVPEAWRVRQEPYEHVTNWSRSWRTADAPGLPRPLAEAEVGHPIKLIRRGDEAAVALAIGSTIRVLELGTGRECDKPFEICPGWSGEPNWCDIDGDRFDDLVVAYEAPLLDTAAPAGLSDSGYFLRAHSLRERRTFWQFEVGKTTDWELGPDLTSSHPAPRVADLDGDGRCEVLLARPAFYPDYRRVCSDLLVWDGNSGQVLWSRRTPLSWWYGAVFNRALIGPDIDRDGVRDLLWADMTEDTSQVALDAISGANGATLWSVPDASLAERPAHEDRRYLAEFGWWNAGSDGWPQCFVLTRPRVDPNSPLPSDALSRLVSFSSGTGRRTFSGTFVTDCAPVDLDHDGQEELLTWGKPIDAKRGWLQITRGAATAWQTPDSWRQTVATDVNHDRVADVIVHGSTGNDSLRDGISGESLAETRVPLQVDSFPWKVIPRSWMHVSRLGDRSRSSVLFCPQIDLDADGVSDLLLTAGPGNDGVLDLLAASGTTGRALWRTRVHADLRDKNFCRLQGLKIDDFDDDGTPDFLASLTGSSLAVEELVLLSGKRGNKLWSSNARDKSAFAPYILTPIVVDADADGRPDILTTKSRPSSDATLDLEAFRGQDGASLWNRQLAWPPGLSAGGESAQARSVGLVAIAGRSTQPASVVVWRPHASHPPAIGPRIRVHCRVEALDARHGTTLWTWDHPDDFEIDAEETDAEQTVRVVVWRKSPSESALAVWRPRTPDVWWELDARGVARSHPVPVASSESTFADAAHTSRDASQSCLWSFDGDGDELDELLVYDAPRNQVVAWDPRDPREPRWSRALAPSGYRPLDQETLPTLAASVDSPRPGWLMGLNPTRSSVIGIELRTGREAWRCPIPFETGIGSWPGACPIHLQGNRSSDEAPFFLFETGVGTIVRQAIWSASTPDVASADGRRPLGVHFARDAHLLPDDWNAWGLARQVAVIPSERDPRWRRALPWIPSELHDIERPHHAGTLRFLLFSAAHLRTILLALGCVVAPAWYVQRVARRRQFHLRQLLLLPLFVGLYLTAWRTSPPAPDTFGAPPDVPQSWLDEQLALRQFGDVARTVFYAAPVGAAGVIVAAAVRRRWRTIGRFALGWILASGLLAAGILILDARAHPLWPEEYYDPSGWPWIGWDGAIVCGWGYFALASLLATYDCSRPRATT